MEKELVIQATLYLQMEENETEEEALDRAHMLIDTDLAVNVHKTEVRDLD